MMNNNEMRTIRRFRKEGDRMVKVGEYKEPVGEDVKVDENLPDDFFTTAKLVLHR